MTRWFERRRGAAIALISSGQYVAGVIWPSLFERAIDGIGWQATMLAYGAITLALILPLTVMLRPTPQAYAPLCRPPLGRRAKQAPARRVMGLPPILAQLRPL